jgi:hypothetical protein
VAKRNGERPGILGFKVTKNPEFRGRDGKVAPPIHIHFSCFNNKSLHRERKKKKGLFQEKSGRKILRIF